MNKQGIDPDPLAVTERWYHRICSQCKLDSVYIYPAGQGPLPKWPEPCVRCEYVPGSTTSPEGEPTESDVTDL